MTFVPGTAFDEIWVRGGVSTDTTVRTGILADALPVVVAVGFDDRHAEYDVTSVEKGTADSMEYEFGPLDTTIVLRVRATKGDGTVGEDGYGGNELFLAASRILSFEVAWKRRGVARLFTAMRISQVSEPETYAREAVASVTLRPGVGNVISVGSALYDTTSADDSAVSFTTAPGEIGVTP